MRTRCQLRLRWIEFTLVFILPSQHIEKHSERIDRIGDNVIFVVKFNICFSRGWSKAKIVHAVQSNTSTKEKKYLCSLCQHHDDLNIRCYCCQSLTKSSLMHIEQSFSKRQADEQTCFRKQNFRGVPLHGIMVGSVEYDLILSLSFVMIRNGVRNRTSSASMNSSWFRLCLQNRGSKNDTGSILCLLSIGSFATVASDFRFPLAVRCIMRCHSYQQFRNVVRHPLRLAVAFLF